MSAYPILNSRGHVFASGAFDFVISYFFSPLVSFHKLYVPLHFVVTNSFYSTFTLMQSVVTVIEFVVQFYFISFIIASS